LAGVIFLALGKAPTVLRPDNPAYRQTGYGNNSSRNTVTQILFFLFHEAKRFSIFG
jgi:hypothetical protein